MPPLLSIVIPAHNEEVRLPSTLEQVWTFLERQSFESEIIIVENGSSDHTLELAQAFARRHPAAQVLQETDAGKGLAVRRGILYAQGEYRFICDADLSMPIEEVLRFLPPRTPDYDIAIASREVPGAIRYGEPAYRHLIGRVFNFMVRTITLPGIQDTQCGFKCFRARVAEDLFHVQTIDGWTFDVELLYVALQRGYRVIEIPIPWYYHPGSRVRIISDSFQMLADLFRIRINDLRGRYAR
ncbi:MAG: glycosyltransferase family 2 protein [Anaerolineales bacterium]